MNSPFASATNASLLSRLRCDQRENEAWAQFVERYGSRLFEWSLQRGLQPDDAEDVTQNVLVKIAQNIHAFEYDPAQSFRGWLRRITENSINDFYRQTRRRRSVSESYDVLADQQAREDLLTRLGEAFDLELLEHAMDRVRSRIDHRRWLAWKKCAQDQLPGIEVAESLGMPVATVYAARYQVQKLIVQEVAALEGGSNSKGSTSEN